MEVSIICSSFIYGERHEERVSGVGGGGGRVQKCILKYFSLVSEEKMEAVTIPIKKNTFKPMSSEKRRQSCSAIDRRLNRSRPERKADGR